MKTVLYDSPFVPPEWIAAHRLQPVRVLPVLSHDRPGAIPRDGVCPYARAFLTTVNSSPAEAAIFATSCDQMRRASELVERQSGEKRAFLLHVPTTWQTDTARQLYTAELERLGHFLVSLGGRAPSEKDLAAVMRRWDAARSLMREARGRLPPRVWAEGLFALNRTGARPAAVEIRESAEMPALPVNEASSGIPASSSGNRAGGSQPENKIPVALVGSPLMASNLTIFNAIEAAGGTVVLDATTSGESSLPAPFDLAQLETAPFRTLADTYFNTIPEAFRRPNDLLYAWLVKKLAERGARGIIFLHYVWCDSWHAEAQPIKTRMQMPLLALEAGDEAQLSAHTLSRIQAFLEMLGAKGSPHGQ